MPVDDISKTKEYTLHLVAGDSRRLELRFLQNGSPIDLSDYTSSVGNIYDRPTAAILQTFTVDATSANVGVFVLTLTTVQTADLCPCDAFWDFQLIHSTTPETNTHTPIGGDVEVQKKGQI